MGDPIDTTVRLLATLEAAVELGELEAARAVLRPLRRHLRDATEAASRMAPVEAARATAPLRELLRRQRDLMLSLDGLELPEGEERKPTAGRWIGQQQDLVVQLDPLLGRKARHPGARKLKKALLEATLEMKAAATLLGAAANRPAGPRADRSIGQAREAAHRAEAGLRAVVRWASEPMGDATGAEDDFVHRLAARELADWELPRELGAVLARHLDDEPERALLEGIARRLAEAGPDELLVRSPPVEGDPELQQVLVWVWSEDEEGLPRRYLVQLRFLLRDQGPLREARDRPRPAPALYEPGERLMAVAGVAQVIYSRPVPFAHLEVLELAEGPGRALYYSAAAEELWPELDDVLRAVPLTVIESPAQAVLLDWLDSLRYRGELPVPEKVLRVLGIEWQDAGDLADVLRPLVSRLELATLGPSRLPDDGGAPTMALLHLDSDSCCFAAALPQRAPDEAPRIVIRESLLAELTACSREDQRGSALIDAWLGALTVHLAVQLWFADQLLDDPGWEAVRRTADALELDFLARQNLPPIALRGLLARLAAGLRKTPSDLAGQGRQLVQAGAGAGILKDGRLLGSALMNSYRKEVERELVARGRPQAARSSLALAEAAELSILFGNLIVDPTTGRGILLTGDSKLGKSAITARLTARSEQGWLFGCSDRVLVACPRDGGAPLAGASPAHRRFGQYGWQLWYRDAHGRSVRPDHRVAHGMVELGALVHIARDGAEHGSEGLDPGIVGGMLRDFQNRFGFVASLRFWDQLLGAVVVERIALPHRGADNFHRIAQLIRGIFSIHTPGAAQPDLVRWVEPGSGAWFGARLRRDALVVTRVDASQLDLVYQLRADGSARARPTELGRWLPLTDGGSFDWSRTTSTIELTEARCVEVHGQTHHKVGRKLLPLDSSRLRAGSSGQRYLVPRLPRVLMHELTARWGGQQHWLDRWLGAPAP